MAVVAGGVAGGAHPCDLLALVDVVAHGDRQAAVVTVPGHIAVAVVDLHKIPVAAHPAGVGHRAAVGGVDGCPLGTAISMPLWLVEPIPPGEFPPPMVEVMYRLFTGQM